MADPQTNSRNWAVRLTGALWLALILFALAGLLVVRHLPVWMIALVTVAGVALGAMLFLPRWLVKRHAPAYSPRRSFVALGLASVLGVTGLVSLPLYYLAFWVQTGPTAVPLVTLSNGRKNLVFQGMQHVASEDFYKSVVFDLEKALVDGYTLFYEGVQPVPGRPDLNEWFNKTLRGTDQDLSSGYVKLADECGLKFQLTYFQPLLADQPIHPSHHVTADVNYLDMKTEYERLMNEDPAFAAAMAAKVATTKQGKAEDPLMPLLDSVTDATQGQKNLIGIVCRGVLGMAVSGKLGVENDPTQRIILDFRNKALARFVTESKDDKIYITYGAAHFPGFFAELQKLDPKFTIRSVKGVRPMTLPDEVNLAPSAVSGSGG
jgi:hypothetical protein